MTWVKLDDQFFANPKVLELSKDAKLLYLGALTHCAAHLTDGYISPASLRLVCALVDVERETVNDLVFAGLWRVSGDGFEVNDYLEYNMSAKQVKARRKANAKRQARYRDRHVERDDDDTDDVSNGVTNALVTAPVTPPPYPSHTHTNTEEEKEEKIAPKTARTTTAVDKPKRNLIFETMYELWLGTPYEPPGECTDDERGRLNRAAGQLARKSDATPGEIARRWHEAEARAGPEYPVTPQTLTKSWTDLAHARSQHSTNGRRPRGSDTIDAARQLFDEYAGDDPVSDRTLAIDR